MTTTETPTAAVRPPGGLDRADLTRQAEILVKASAASPIRQFRYWLADLATGFEQALEHIRWAEDDQGEVVAVELAGSLTPGMSVVTDIGFLRLVKISRRDGDWSLLLKCETFEQRQLNNSKNDYWLNLTAAGQSPVVVLA